MMGNDIRHVIWSNNDLAFAEWEDWLQEEYPDKSQAELEQLMYEINDGYLNDERMNLDIDVGQPIIAIANLGLWNGRHSGYKEIDSGNIRDCLYSSNDYTTWYVDKSGDLRCDDIHHDGTNHYLYRAFKRSATDWQRENLKAKIYNNAFTREDIARVTCRLGDIIGAVYGWNFPGRPSELAKEIAK